MPGDWENRTSCTIWLKKKQAPWPRQKPWETISKTTFWAGEGWPDKKQILRLGKHLQKPLVKQRFGLLHEMARKKQTLGRQRVTIESPGRPFKNLGKTKGCYRGAAGNLRACWGPPGKSYGRWKTFKNLGKTKVSHLGTAGKQWFARGGSWATSKILRLNEPLENHWENNVLGSCTKGQE